MTHQDKEKRRSKEQLYHLFARVASAMANPHRLELLDLLVQAPRTVEELAAEAQMSMANTSQHLQRLKQARLVVDEREGIYIRYRLADPVIARLWLELRGVARCEETVDYRILELVCVCYGVGFVKEDDLLELAADTLYQAIGYIRLDEVFEAARAVVI